MRAQPVRARAPLLALALALAVPRGARAEERAEAPRSPSAAHTAAALVPGAIVHGAGHFAAGQPRTGWTLLALEGAGLVAMGAGLTTLAATGASPQVVVPSIALLTGGFGLFAGSYASDVYGVSAPDALRGSPLTRMPRVTVRSGLGYGYDPTWLNSALFVSGADIRNERLRLSPELWGSLDGSTARGRVALAYRFLGPLGGASAAPTSDGTFLEAEVAGGRHSIVRERVAIDAIDVQLAGRLDLARLAPTLRGSFADASLGTSLQRYGYRVARAEADVTSVLLARIAYGFYFGRRDGRWGEAALFYDHRHDGLSGGMKLSGVGVGALGSVGARSLAYLTPTLGVLCEAQVGSASVTSLSLLYRTSAPPAPVGAR